MQHAQKHEKTTPSLRPLLAMIALSFVAMFVLMYMMVDSLANVIPNINQFYMAGIMTAPMVVFEVLLMKEMYPDKKLNRLLIGLSVTTLLLFTLLLRRQVLVGDAELLRAMIPHHAGAILMCERAQLKDPEVQKLCETIIASQKEEIEVMKQKLGSL